MHETLIYKNLHIHLVINPKLKHSYLKVADISKVEIKTPIKSTRFIYDLIDQRYEWILKQIDSMKKRPQLHVEVGKEILLFGEICDIKEEKISYIQDRIMRLKSINTQKFLKIYDDFYKMKAQEYLTQRVSYFSQIMELVPTKILFRKMRSRWGSCSSKKELTFNIYLLKLPTALIDYVVVHELAHLKHMNHSKRFHDLVQKHLKDAKYLKQQISTWHLRE
jgi:predicted metal-dependent hydrolase